jgi:hypothetical protein
MSRELGGGTERCERSGATLVVEVARVDEEPLNAGPRVRLSGPSAVEAMAAGTPARARFDDLDPGRYTIALELDGDDDELEAVETAPISVILRANDVTAVRVELRSDWEIVDVGFALEEEVFDDAGDAPDDDADDDDDDWDLIELGLGTKLDDDDDE